MGGESDPIRVSGIVINSVLAAIGGVVLLLAPWSSYLSAATAFVIANAARLFGVDVAFIDGQLKWQQLTIAWTEDCSGVQTLFVLFGLMAWVSLRTPWTVFLARLLSTFAMALVANVVRVLAICGLRSVLYPHWEGETFHYTVGCLTLLPFALLIARQARRDSGIEIAWFVYLASILAVCSLSIETPGGTMVLLSTLVFLVVFQESSPQPHSGRGVLVILWFAIAVAIACLSAESLWLPWLLSCPVFTRVRALWHPAAWLLLLGTVPLLSANVAVQMLVAVSAVYVLFETIRSNRSLETEASDDQRPRPVPSIAGYLVVVVALLAPGCSELLLAQQNRSFGPPVGVMSMPVGTGDTFRVRTVGQTNDIAAFWCGNARNGRHHSIATCLSYRGIETSPLSAQNGVVQSDTCWIAEFFILDGQLCPSYHHYVMHCFPPLTSQGVQLVFQASKSSMDPDHFYRQAKELALELHDAQLKSATSATGRSR